jgi:hypothetical protein
MAETKRNNPTLALIVVALLAVVVIIALVGARGVFRSPQGEKVMPTNGSPATSAAQPQPAPATPPS